MIISSRTLLCVLIFSVFFLSDVSAKKKASQDFSKEAGTTDADSGEDYVPSAADSVRIAIPSRKERQYFSTVDKKILALVEDGAPESLKSAIAILKKNADRAAENENVLLAVAINLMKYCWPSEDFHEVIPNVSFSNPYLGAIESSKDGVYDYSTGKADFLSLMLPSLVLVVSDTRKDYYDDAKADLAEALKKNDSSVLANYLSGVLYKRLKNYKESLAYFEAAQKSSPGTFEILFSVADLNFRLKNYKTAFSKASALYEKYPQNRDVLKLCAESSYASGDLASAEAFVGRVLQQESGNADYILFRARILIKKGDYIRASSLLDVYSRTDSKKKEYLILRSKIQKEWNKNITAATNTIETALSLYPDDMDIILHAASISSETGGKINGISSGQLASIVLMSEPENVDALQIQIEEFVALEEWGEAYKASSFLLGLENVPDSAVYMHIKICLADGKNDEAWSLAKKMYAEKENEEKALQSYISVLVATNRGKDASKLIEQLLPSSTSKMKSFLYFQRSQLSNNEDKVLADLRSSLTANPRNRDSLFKLYTIYYNKKEYRKALYYLKQVVALSPNDEKLLQLNANLESLLSK